MTHTWKRWVGAGALAISAVLMGGVVHAHEAHKKKDDEVHPVVADSAVAGMAGVERGTTQAGMAAQAGQNVEIRERYVMPGLGEALFEHLHNKVVHFPIALGLFAVFLMLMARGRPELSRPARWLVWTATVMAIAAYFTGRAQEGAFEGDSKEWLVELHEKVGLATVLGFVIWSVMTMMKPLQKYAVWLGLVVALLITAAAGLGGLVAHG